MSSDYERYIRTAELLVLQKEPAEQVNHDELLFQVTHQSSELWMKAILQDMTETIRLMRLAAGNEEPSPYREGADSDRYPALPRAAQLLERTAHIIGMLSRQILTLERMAPADYHQIRTALGRGSGQDSPGFNRILAMASPLTEAWKRLLESRQATPVAVLTNPYEYGELHGIVQGLLAVDEAFGRFRTHHLSLVKRQIGLAVKSLKGVPARKLVEGTQAEMFPDLWAAVSEVTNTYNPSY